MNEGIRISTELLEIPAENTQTLSQMPASWREGYSWELRNWSSEISFHYIRLHGLASRGYSQCYGHFEKVFEQKLRTFSVSLFLVVKLLAKSKP